MVFVEFQNAVSWSDLIRFEMPVLWAVLQQKCSKSASLYLVESHVKDSIFEVTHHLFDLLLFWSVFLLVNVF